MIAYVALGSNLGDRLGHLRKAVERLQAVGQLVACSSVYETEPRDYTDQPHFLNAAVALNTRLSPGDLLAALLRIESSLGRERHADQPPKGPRRIDLDILLYNSQVVDTPGLQLPHPRLHERLFVLMPLAEIASALSHPVLHRSISALRDAVSVTETAEAVRVFAPPLC
jgi:2-amino-4-hydroxy-6-hydroxymethyldihydropteridine diphosphokinase